VSRHGNRGDRRSDQHDRHDAFENTRVEYEARFLMQEETAVMRKG
jgi:hypothetical protein